MHKFVLIVLATLSASVALAQESKGAPDAKPAAKSDAEAKPVTAETAKSALDFTMKDIEGHDVPLSQYKGKVVMIVNVASKCGMTPQYEQLQAAYEKYHDRGFEVLGFPANNFGSQEPGTDSEIREFCTSKYHVKFPMFSKISVKGDDQAELYKFLTSPEKTDEYGSPIQWNFTKFVVDRNGKVIGRFEPRTRPDDKGVVELIEKALDEKASEPKKS